MKTLVTDTLAVALVGGLVFLGLRQWVGDRYVVPSDSMQPTLYGSHTGGDIVFVDKTAHAAGLRRYDLGVFRLPDEPGVLVKRVVAFGDDAEHCCLELRDGDLWLGPDVHRLERAVKEPLEARDLRVPWLEWPTRLESTEGEFTRPAGGGRDGLALPVLDGLGAARRACSEEVRRALASEAQRGDQSGGGWLATTRAIDATYLDAHGSRGREGGNILVDDVGADLRFACAGVADVLCGLDLRPDSWLFHWRPASGEVELWRNGETVATHALPPRAGPSAGGAEGHGAVCRVEYGYLDGRFFFAVDGAAERLWVVPRRAEWLVADPGPTGWSLPKNRLYLGVLGDGPAQVVRLQVFHDVHWFRPQMEIGVDPARFTPARMVPRGEVYLLGDNAVDSRDSRMFGPVPVTGFVGRPRAILGPWPRHCVLPR